jgi:U6 snRNA-associated Sm-like protein LSm8
LRKILLISSKLASTSASLSGTANPTLTDLVEKTMSVITCDGRSIIGRLRGFDQTLNVILEQSHERDFRLDFGGLQNELGIYIIRGDNM